MVTYIGYASCALYVWYIVCLWWKDLQPLKLHCLLLAAHFSFWYLMYLFYAVMSISELHSVRMLYSMRCVHAVFSLNCTFQVHMHRSCMWRLRIPPLFLHDDSVSLILHLFHSHFFSSLFALCTVRDASS